LKPVCAGKVVERRAAARREKNGGQQVQVRRQSIKTALKRSRKCFSNRKSNSQRRTRREKLSRCVYGRWTEEEEDNEERARAYGVRRYLRTVFLQNIQAAVARTYRRQETQTTGRFAMPLKKRIHRCPLQSSSYSCQISLIARHHLAKPPSLLPLLFVCVPTT
jgi:hypothetical protein